MAIQLESVVNITLSLILIGLVLYIVFKPEDDDDQVKFDAAANFNQKQYDLLKEQLSIQEKLVDAQIAEMQKEPPVIEEHDDADEMNVTQYCGSGGVKGLGDIGVTGIEPTDIGLTDLRPSENLPQDIPARILNATFDSENSLVVSFTAAVSGDSNPIGTYLVMVEGKSWRISNTMSPYVIPESKLKMQGVPEGLITVKMFGETTRGHQIHPTNEDAKSVYYTERPRAVITPVVPNATAPNATPPNTTVPNASPPPPVSTSVNPPSNVSVVTYASGTMTISFTPPPTNALETFTNSTDYYLVTVENKGVSYKFSTAAQNDSITFDDNNTIEIQMRGNDMNGTGYAFPELEQLSVSMQFASGDKMSPPSQKVPVISKGYEIVATATTPGSVTGPFTLTAYEEGYLIVEFTTPMSFGGDFSHYIVNIGANGQTFKFSTKADTDGNAGFKIPDSSQTVNYQTLSGGRGKIGITAVGTDMDGKAYNFAAGTKLWISVSTVNATGAESGAVSVNGGVQLLSKGDGETPIDAWTINDIVDAEGHRSIDIPEHLSIAKKQPWIFINDIPEGVKIHLNVKNMTTGKETEPFYVVNTPGYSCYYAANGNPVCGMSGGTTYVPGWIKGSGKPNIKNANIQDHAEHGRFLTLLYDANATDTGSHMRLVSHLQTHQLHVQEHMIRVQHHVALVPKNGFNGPDHLDAQITQSIKAHPRHVMRVHVRLEVDRQRWLLVNQSRHRNLLLLQNPHLLLLLLLLQPQWTVLVVGVNGVNVQNSAVEEPLHERIMLRHRHLVVDVSVQWPMENNNLSHVTPRHVLRMLIVSVHGLMVLVVKRVAEVPRR
jgi:hypothetical protein